MPSEALLIGIATIAVAVAGFTAVTRQRAIVSTSFNVEQGNRGTLETAEDDLAVNQRGERADRGKLGDAWSLPGYEVRDDDQVRDAAREQAAEVGASGHERRVQARGADRALHADGLIDAGRLGSGIERIAPREGHGNPRPRIGWLNRRVRAERDQRACLDERPQRERVLGPAAPAQTLLLGITAQVDRLD